MQWVLSIFYVFLVSCGYHFNSPSEERPVVTILPIKADFDGQFSQALVEELTHAKVKYAAFNAKYEVEVQLVQFNTSHTDYQYQTDDETSKVINRLSPVEGEHDIIVNVSVYKKGSKKKILGPISFRQTYHYDFTDFRSYHDLSFTDSDGISNTVLNYSLGQLAAEDDAKSSAKKCLYQKISKKIAAFLSLKLD